jgi:hypothetical protein
MKEYECSNLHMLHVLKEYECSNLHMLHVLKEYQCSNLHMLNAYFTKFARVCLQDLEEVSVC